MKKIAALLLLLLLFPSLAGAASDIDIMGQWQLTEAGTDDSAEYLGDALSAIFGSREIIFEFTNERRVRCFLDRREEALDAFYTLDGDTLLLQDNGVNLVFTFAVDIEAETMTIENEGNRIVLRRLHNSVLGQWDFSQAIAADGTPVDAATMTSVLGAEAYSMLFTQSGTVQDWYDYKQPGDLLPYTLIGGTVLVGSTALRFTLEEDGTLRSLLEGVTFVFEKKQNGLEGFWRIARAVDSAAGAYTTEQIESAMGGEDAVYLFTPDYRIEHYIGGNLQNMDAHYAFNEEDAIEITIIRDGSEAVFLFALDESDQLTLIGEEIELQLRREL